MRVIWLCEELNIDYKVIKIDFSARYRATPEWRALNPVGKVPVMTDGDLVMFESGAMVQYILDKYAPGQLALDVDHPEYGLYLQWLWFAEATLARPLGEIVNHRREFPKDKEIPAVVAEMQNRAESCLIATADHLRSRTYLVGEQFTAADIMMGYSIAIAEALIGEKIPKHLQPYWQRLKERPAFIKASSL